METIKPSFLIYLDTYVHVMALSVEQRGELFTSLLWYANNAARREHPMDVTVAGAQCKSLTPDARMAFYFMADAIYRDTEKWNEKRKRCRTAATKREAEKRQKPPEPFRGRGIDVYPSQEEVEAMEKG